MKIWCCMKNCKDCSNFLIWSGQKLVKADQIQIFLGNLPKIPIFCLYSAMFRPGNIWEFQEYLRWICSKIISFKFSTYSFTLSNKMETTCRKHSHKTNAWRLFVENKLKFGSNLMLCSQWLQNIHKFLIFCRQENC